MLFQESDKRGSTMAVKLTSQERQAVREAAQKAGISLSRFVRKALLRYLAQHEPAAADRGRR